MTKAQWKALFDFIEDLGYTGKYEVLNELKRKGSIKYTDTFDDLGSYDGSGTYDGMMKFLTEELV